MLGSIVVELDDLFTVGLSLLPLPHAPTVIGRSASTKMANGRRMFLQGSTAEIDTLSQQRSGGQIEVEPLWALT